VVIGLAAAGAAAEGAGRPKAVPVHPRGQDGDAIRDASQRLRYQFLPDGVRVSPDPAPEPGWTWGLEIATSGEAKAVGPAHRIRSASGVEYQRRDLDEWWIAGKKGLEHGFTLREPAIDPGAGDGSIRVDAALNGNLSWRPSDDGSRIEFLEPGGSSVL